MNRTRWTVGALVALLAITIAYWAVSARRNQSGYPTSPLGEPTVWPPLPAHLQVMQSLTSHSPAVLGATTPFSITIARGIMAEGLSTVSIDDRGNVISCRVNPDRNATLPDNYSQVATGQLSAEQIGHVRSVFNNSPLGAWTGCIGAPVQDGNELVIVVTAGDSESIIYCHNASTKAIDDFVAAVDAIVTPCLSHGRWENDVDQVHWRCLGLIRDAIGRTKKNKR